MIRLAFKPLFASLLVSFALHSPLRGAPLLIARDGIPKPSYKEWVEIVRWWHPKHRDWADWTAGSKVQKKGYARLFKKLFYLRRKAHGSSRVKVSRWWSPKDRDWVTIPHAGPGHISAALLKKWGYTSAQLLGYASLRPFAHSVGVSRWWSPKDRDWVTIPHAGPGHISDALLKSWGYSSKKFLFYARRHGGKKSTSTR